MIWSLITNKMEKSTIFNSAYNTYYILSFYDSSVNLITL